MLLLHKLPPDSRVKTRRKAQVRQRGRDKSCGSSFFLFLLKKMQLLSGTFFSFSLLPSGLISLLGEEEEEDATARSFSLPAVVGFSNLMLLDKK